MIEEMWMIRPHRRSFIGPTSARVRAMHELRFSSTSRSQSSSWISSIGCGILLPALLTRMSTWPISSMAESASRRTSSRRVMSATKWTTLTPVPDADLVRGGPELVLVSAGDDDVGAGLRETAGHRLAEPLAAPGHEGHASRSNQTVGDSLPIYHRLEKAICSSGIRGVVIPSPVSRR